MYFIRIFWKLLQFIFVKKICKCRVWTKSQYLQVLETFDDRKINSKFVIWKICYLKNLLFEKNLLQVANSFIFLDEDLKGNVVNYRWDS